MENENNKILEYDAPWGKEQIRLWISHYIQGEHLYIGMESYEEEEGDWGPFGDLTVNEPFTALSANEAYLTDCGTEYKIAFIEKHKLGKVVGGRINTIPGVRVAFDMERLRELDPKGVDAYLKIHPEYEKELKAIKRKKSQMER